MIAALFTTVAMILVPMTAEEDAILQQRVQIRSLELSINTRSSAGESMSTHKSKLWCDGMRLREDRFFGNESRPLREIRCFDGSELIYWKSDEIDGEVGIAVHRWRAEQVRALRDTDPLRFPLNPMVFGLVLSPIALLTDATVADAGGLIGSADRHKLNISSSEYQGRDCREITFETAMGAPVRIVLDPAQGNNAVLLAIRGANHSLEAKYELHEASNVWFPKKLVYHSEMSPETRLHEETTVSIERINEEIDPSVFTLAGMDIPPGKEIVSFPRDRRPTFWNGRLEVKRMPTSVRPVGAKSPTLPPPRPIILPALILLCLVVGVMALVMFMRNKSA